MEINGKQKNRKNSQLRILDMIEPRLSGVALVFFCLRPVRAAFMWSCKHWEIIVTI